jgi:hypothetical protein
VLFVAHPAEAPPRVEHAYARPDDVSENGQTWRERLLDHNKPENGNPHQLLPAYRLYAPEVYCALVDRFGIAQVFILSAGWGLIPASFPTPLYDITFTAQAEPWIRRRKRDRYEDFCLMRDDGEEILFLGGKDYLPLFTDLTARYSGRKTVTYNSARPPAVPTGFTLLRYPTSGHQNWHYGAARDLIRGQFPALPA